MHVSEDEFEFSASFQTKSKLSKQICLPDFCTSQNIIVNLLTINLFFFYYYIPYIISKIINDRAKALKVILHNKSSLANIPVNDHKVKTLAQTHSVTRTNLNDCI